MSVYNIVCEYTYIYTYAYIYTHMHIYTHRHIYIYTYIYTHVYTYMNETNIYKKKYSRNTVSKPSLHPTEDSNSSRDPRAKVALWHSAGGNVVMGKTYGGYVSC